MPNQFDEITEILKRFFGDTSRPFFGGKKKIDVDPQKRVHVQLIAELTKIIRIIDTQPSVMRSCEEAKSTVAKAPLGTLAVGKKSLEQAIEDLESVQEQEPQIRAPLKKLKPLVKAYTSV